MVGPPDDEYDGYRECSLWKLIQSDYAQNKKHQLNNMLDGFNCGKMCAHDKSLRQWRSGNKLYDGARLKHVSNWNRHALRQGKYAVPIKNHVNVLNLYFMREIFNIGKFFIKIWYEI